MITFQKIAILGMGFMGASLASSVRRFGSPGVQIRGYDPLEGRSAWSQSAGIVDQVFSNIADTVQGADLIVSAAPVDHIVSTLVEASLYAKHGAIFTDMGSTRERIETTLLKEFSAGVSHAGSHPMAGSEKTGPESNKDILFVGKWVFLTPGTASAPMWLGWEPRNTTVLSPIPAICLIWRLLPLRKHCPKNGKISSPGGFEIPPESPAD